MTPEERILSFCERLPRDMELSPAHELLILKEIKAAVEEERAFFTELCERVINANNQVKGDGSGINLLMADLISKIRARSESPTEPPNGVNWRETLFSILNAVAAAEGVLFDSWWTDYGVSEAERDMILAEWRKRNEPPEKR